MEINMNGNVSDTNYRYKIPQFEIMVCGKGNGIYTIFNNMEEISKKIGHPEEVLFKYIASVTGSSYTKETHSITGTHDVTNLTKIILEYIRFLVMCPKCNIPETIPVIIGTKKNTNIKLSCLACKNESDISNSNKHINKGIEIIIKYLNNIKEWEINKTATVFTQNTTDDANDDFNPFMQS